MIFIAIFFITGGLYISLRNISEIDSFLTQIPGSNLIFQTDEKPARSVILMIGDGMGSEHRLAAQYVNVGSLGVLEMDGLGVSGKLNH